MTGGGQQSEGDERCGGTHGPDLLLAQTPFTDTIASHRGLVPDTMVALVQVVATTDGEVVDLSRQAVADLRRMGVRRIQVLDRDSMCRGGSPFTKPSCGGIWRPPNSPRDLC